MGRKCSIKVIFVKSLGYRIMVIAYESIIAFLLAYIGIKAVQQFIILNNFIKFFGYFVYELIWVGYLRTKLNLIERIRRWLNGS